MDILAGYDVPIRVTGMDCRWIVCKLERILRGHRVWLQGGRDRSRVHEPGYRCSWSCRMSSQKEARLFTGAELRHAGSALGASTVSRLFCYVIDSQTRRSVHLPEETQRIIITH